MNRCIKKNISTHARIFSTSTQKYWKVEVVFKKIFIFFTSIHLYFSLPTSTFWYHQAWVIISMNFDLSHGSFSLLWQWNGWNFFLYQYMFATAVRYILLHDFHLTFALQYFVSITKVVCCISFEKKQSKENFSQLLISYFTF